MLKVTAAAIAAATIAVALAATSAEAAPRKRHVARTHTHDRVAMVRPRTRFTVRGRSYLDGGTEVLPGERKFNDYARPVGALAISPRDPYRGGDIQWNSSSWPPGTFPGF